MRITDEMIKALPDWAQVYIKNLEENFGNKECPDGKGRNFTVVTCLVRAKERNSPCEKCWIEALRQGKAKELTNG